jgi:hypothetical protein
VPVPGVLSMFILAFAAVRRRRRALGVVASVLCVAALGVVVSACGQAAPADSGGSATDVAPATEKVVSADMVRPNNLRPGARVQELVRPNNLRPTLPRAETMQSNAPRQ